MKVVVLNVCFSEPQAQAIARHIDCVIGTKQDIGDDTAIAFSVGFYQALAAGRSVEDAFQLGCAEIRMAGIPEHLIPVFIRRPCGGMPSFTLKELFRQCRDRGRMGLDTYCDPDFDGLKGVIGRHADSESAARPA